MEGEGKGKRRGRGKEEEGGEGRDAQEKPWPRACCISVSDVAYRQRLRSASSHAVSVPRHQFSTYGRRAFAVAGPTVWNSLPEYMRDSEVSEDSYRQSLKTFLFSQY